MKQDAEEEKCQCVITESFQHSHNVARRREKKWEREENFEFCHRKGISAIKVDSIRRFNSDDNSTSCRTVLIAGKRIKVNCETVFLSVDFDCTTRGKMTRIEIVVCLLLGVFCFMQISSAAPAVAEGNNNVVDEILMRLKQLRQQSEGKDPWLVNVGDGKEKFCVETWKFEN